MIVNYRIERFELLAGHVDAAGDSLRDLAFGGTEMTTGKPRWMILDESFSSDKLIEFPQALIQDAHVRCAA